MVEITRPNTIGSSSSSRAVAHTTEEDRFQLVYSKSKVYVNPTAYARDNIPGFVALVKRESQNPTYLLAWIPETLLNEKGSAEWDKFVKIEERALQDQEDDDVVLIDLPTQRPESYAFSVPLTSIYSLIVQPPSLSSWYGSIGINLINGDTLPTLHFHDDESKSFTIHSPATARSPNYNVPFTSASTSTAPHPGTTTYPPPPPPGQISHQSKPINSWGGEDLLSRLRQYAHILRSTLQPTLFLVDPSRADIETHTTQIFDDDAVDDILAQSSFANSHSPVPAHRRPRPISTSGSSNSNSHSPANAAYSHNASVLHRSLGSAGSYNPLGNPQGSSQARMAFFQSFSNITRATRHAAQNILSHPLAKPIVPHLPDPVKSLVSAPGEWEWGSWVEKGGVGEFESARVYLARWARIVAEEGERARRREAQALPSVYADNESEASSLGIFELLHTTANLPTPKSSRNPEKPVNEKEVEEFRREVFRRGISTSNLRKKIWPFLLGVFDWESSAVEREKFWQRKRQEYQEVKDTWCGVPEVFERQDTIEERHRIDVDCRRTDRTQPLFATPAGTPGESNEKKEHLRYSTISPNLSDFGAQSPTNEHIERLGAILLTYNFYEKDLGYVQGMSDLCAPLYVVMDTDEEMTFWCFVSFMERMKKNFLRDQSGMKKQLSTLQQLIEVMDPELFRHLDKTDGLNLFFCFRWVLIAFKREFPFDEVLRLWEVLWTDYYSTQFVLFVALAVLESHRDMILRYLVEFDEILKYCNELSMTIELDTTLAQAEVLFLSFAQLVADIDRRKAEEEAASSRTNGLRNRTAGVPSVTEQAKQTNLSLLKLSDGLRELLVILLTRNRGSLSMQVMYYLCNKPVCERVVEALAQDAHIVQRPLTRSFMANLTILRTYALKKPTELPPSVLFSSSEKAITIFDAYPKSMFHFLVLPRVLSPPIPTLSLIHEDSESSPQSTFQVSPELATPPPSVADLSSLRSLLNSKNVSKTQAKEVIESLKDVALGVKAEIEKEMKKRHGFVWDVWIGFHGTPSMEHMHLHVLSGDLCSERLKIKKHYNSFHPQHGFFLHVDEVLSWFEAEPSYYQSMAKLSPSKYEPLLKDPLICFHCGTEKKNMPTLKAHLQEEWEKLKKRAEVHKKRKLAADELQTDTISEKERDSNPVPKKSRTNSL
ncbi:hypothetical protein NP233_g2081 [Leucocoprinus birnbaumii]|uniref:Rab-GAP TBC domain-containing protein n=1 Tax=Leucocoprinus birnbaumii TaxID=56174 RepID=A0AAD5VYV0_9AGAR|nr:hypothetical protein NP233_g2081 [Leucocoprinus birnbaumii]